MTPADAQDHIEQALRADSRPEELQNESTVVAAMVDAIASNALPPANVLPLDQAPVARARGRRRVASLVIAAALCTTTVAAAAGGMGGLPGLPDLPDWSDFLPVLESEPASEPEDDGKPRFELGEIEIPPEVMDPVDAETPGTETDPEPVPESGGPDVRTPDPADDAEERPSDPDDRKGGPSEEKRADAEDRKGGPSEEKREGPDWRLFDDDESDKTNSGKSDSAKGNSADKGKEDAEKPAVGQRSASADTPSAAKSQSGEGETSEGYEGKTAPRAEKKSTK